MTTTCVREGRIGAAQAGFDASHNGKARVRPPLARADQARRHRLALTVCPAKVDKFGLGPVSGAGARAGGISTPLLAARKVVRALWVLTAGGRTKLGGLRRERQGQLLASFVQCHRPRQLVKELGEQGGVYAIQLLRSFAEPTAAMISSKT